MPRSTTSTHTAACVPLGHGTNAGRSKLTARAMIDTAFLGSEVAQRPHPPRPASRAPRTFFVRLRSGAHAPPARESLHTTAWGSGGGAPPPPSDGPSSLASWEFVGRQLPRRALGGV